MTENEIRQLVNQLTSGYTFVGKYIIDIPSAQVLAEADNIYETFLYQNRFEEVIREYQTKVLLMKHGLWSVFDDKEFESLPKRLDSTKLELFYGYTVPSRARRIRDRISSIHSQYTKLADRRSLFDKYTIEALADLEREYFIINNTLLDNKYNKTQVRPILLERILLESRKKVINVKKYRELARNEYWTNIWSTSGLSCFRQIGDAQRLLISYTKFYDNISSHPESPSSIVMNDDDLLDGWLIHIKQKQEQEKRTSDFDKNNRHTNANEHFIMTSNSAEDIQSVLDMNDSRGRVIQKKIHNMTSERGSIKDLDISEIRQDATIKKM